MVYSRLGDKTFRRKTFGRQVVWVTRSPGSVLRFRQHAIVSLLLTQHSIIRQTYNSNLSSHVEDRTKMSCMLKHFRSRVSAQGQCTKNKVDESMK